LGAGGSVKNLDLLLSGRLFSGLLLGAPAGAADSGPVRPFDPLLAGAGLLYLVGQTLLMGGLLTTLASARGAWKLPGFSAACGRHFARCLRLALAAGAVYAAIFAASGWAEGWVEHQARAAVSGRAAHAWLFGRYAAVLLLLLTVHLVTGYARVRLVVGERRSAVAALLGALDLCRRQPALCLGHYLGVVLIGAAAFGVYLLLDGSFQFGGPAALVWMLVLAQAWVALRIYLRLALAAGQIDISRRCGLV
jgi:hypothetical protein